MPRNDSGQSRSGKRSGLPVDRRSYLKLAGVAAGSVPLLSGTASAATERRGIRFERTVDMVRDAGCDPTGQEPCDAKIRAAADDYTLLKFPSGEYKLTEKNVIFDKTNLGFLGVGNVRFKVPERYNDKVLLVERGTGLLFEGIDIDQQADGATPALHLAADDDLRVHDVELIGQGIHPDSIPRDEPGWEPGPGPENGNPAVKDFFYPIVRSSDGTGVVTNLKANNHGLMGTYNAGSGRSGIWVGTSNQGTITFKDCHIEEFGSNGCYTSRTYGVVRYESGVYRNNDNNQIRIGSPGSSIENASIEVDADASDAPNPYEALNYRGIRVEMGRQHDRTDVVIRDCDISIQSANHSDGSVVADHTASQFRIENTRIGVDADGVRGVLGKEPNGGGAYPPPTKPHTGILRNVSITGSAAGDAAIELRNRPDSVVEGCCIQTAGAGRDGVTLLDSDGCVVRNSTINVSDEAVISEDSNITVSGIIERGSCPTPTDTLPSDDPDDGFDATLTIHGAPGADYEVAVSGSLEKSDTADPNDALSGSSATGQVGEYGRDSYAFTGEITRLVLNGGAKLYYNGEQVDPAEYLANTVTVESQSDASYEITTSDGIVKSAVMGASDPNDTISGRTASGYVGEGGIDSYAYPGEITGIDIDGDATVYRNGEEIDPDELGTGDTLTIHGAPGADYELAVSESLEKSDTADPNDELSGSSATGQVGEYGRDSYAFTGEITRLVLNGGAKLYYNGVRTDPADYLQNTVTIESQSDADYEITTSDGIVKSAAMGAADPNDVISGRTASGYVGEGGIDSYAYPGEITGIDIDGDATVYRNGAEIDPDEFGDGDTLTIHGAPGADYELAVSESLEKSDTADPNDALSGSSVSGQVGEHGRDSYAFTGEVTRLVLNGGAKLYYNGEQVDPAEYLKNTVTIESQSDADYEITTSDGIVKSAVMGASDPNDTISGTTASGYVGEGGRDSYAYPGEITGIDIDGDATVYRNGSVLQSLERVSAKRDALPTFGRLS